MHFHHVQFVSFVFTREECKMTLFGVPITAPYQNSVLTVIEQSLTGSGGG